VNGATFTGDPHVTPLEPRSWIWGYAATWPANGKTRSGVVVSAATFESKADAIEDLREELGSATLAVRCTCVACDSDRLARRLRRKAAAS